MKHTESLLQNLLPGIRNLAMALGLSLLVAALFVVAAGKNPLVVYSSLLSGAFGGIDAIASTLERATPLIFSGIAMMIGFRGGFLNLGVEGQLYLGAMAAAIVGFSVSGLPAVCHTALALLAAGVVGTVWAAIAALLRTLWNVSEIVVTIMLNYVAILLTSYLVNYPFKAPGPVQYTVEVLRSASLPRFLPPSRLNLGFFIAIGIAALVYWILWKTPKGYEIRMVGLNKRFASYIGVNPASTYFLTGALSGFVAGLAGAEQVLGIHLRFIENISMGLGWTGLIVALLGRNHPAGVVVGGIFLGALANGGLQMQVATGISRSFTFVLQAIILFFLAAGELRVIVRRRGLLVRG